MYRIIIYFDADGIEQAKDAVDVVNTTLPYVVDNIEIVLIDEDNGLPVTEKEA